ncbi:MAG: hypothetical protein ABIQ47_06035 [Tepidiformaceae bacterium]
MRPPRALWVPFELGRPFGTPNAPGFQEEVLRNALAMLAEPTGPVIRDFGQEPPSISTDEDAGPWVCALPAAPMAEARNEAEGFEMRLLAEIAQLRPWYEESVRTRGRTAIGVSGRDAEAVPEMAATLAAIASGQTEPALALASLGPPMSLRFIADDLKAFYFEAAAAQPASRPPSTADLNRWLFGQTALGEVLYAARDVLLASPEADAKLPGRFLVPNLYATKPAPA